MLEWLNVVRPAVSYSYVLWLCYNNLNQRKAHCCSKSGSLRAGIIEELTGEEWRRGSKVPMLLFEVFVSMSGGRSGSRLGQM